VLAAPRNTGSPTMPSRPVVATYTSTWSSVMPTIENAEASGKYTSVIGPPGLVDLLADLRLDQFQLTGQPGELSGGQRGQDRVSFQPVCAGHRHFSWLIGCGRVGAVFMPSAI
jgi:hypothetical protein